MVKMNMNAEGTDISHIQIVLILLGVRKGNEGTKSVYRDKCTYDVVLPNVVEILLNSGHEPNYSVLL